jgi:tetratricopeptide (TPR) repeat protein
MFDVLRQLGKEKVERIDETLAREVGRQTGTRALLLATIRRLGESYVVDLRALDPQKDEYLFTVRDRASRKEAIFELVDRLGESARQRLAATRAPERAGQRGVASITTTSVAAWDQLSRARQATDHGKIAEARKLAQAAVETDPEFALAHYQLAMLSIWGEVKVADMRRLFAAAEQRADRLPEKERLLLRSIVAFEDGRFTEAVRLRDQLAEAYPLDKEAVFYAGDLRFHTGQPAEAIPYFLRALQLDPAYGLCGEHLAEALANTVAGDQHLDWLRREAAATTEPNTLRAVARALLSIGQEREAIAVFLRAVKGDGGFWPTPMYASYLTFQGKAPEAEAGLRGELARLSRMTGEEAAGFSDGARAGLQWVLVAQGRLAEAGALDGMVGGQEEPTAYLQLRQAAVARSPGTLRAAAEELYRGAPWSKHLSAAEIPQFIGTGTVALADAGDVAGAARLVEGLQALPAWEKVHPLARRFMESFPAWRDGNRAHAEEGFRGHAAHSDLQLRYLGLLLLGDLEQEGGNCAAAVASWEQVRALRWSPATIEHWTWTYPGMLHSLARCYEQAGDLARARERNEELLRRWARADPDLPLLIEARALKARLATAPK